MLLQEGSGERVVVPYGISQETYSHARSHLPPSSPRDSSRRSPMTFFGHHPSSSTLRSQASDKYRAGRYEEALELWQRLLRDAPNDEHLHSNLVACHLQLNSHEEALRHAQICVELKPRWAKGHVRLASALIALGNRSNDACQALQTALRLDPGNHVARQLLVRELRRDHAAAAAVNISLPLETEDEPPTCTSWKEWLQEYQDNATTWYQNQSDDTKTGIWILVGLLGLYVAFGGRFGLEYLSYTQPQPHGNYGRQNAYDEYYRHRYELPSMNLSRSNHHGGSLGGDSSGLFSLLAVLGLAYFCQQAGINPFHAMWMARMMRGRRQGGFYGWRAPRRGRRGW